MTNFDPGLLLLLTVIPAVVAGVVSVGVAHLAARLGVGDYETNVAAVVGLLLVAWVVAATIVTTGMLRILAVTLAMAGAYAATRDVTATSYGWVLGVILLFGTFLALSALGVYQGVDRTGRPRGVLAEHFQVFYHVGLLAAGAVAGKAVALGRATLADRGRR